jgi:hypothetical protein
MRILTNLIALSVLAFTASAFSPFGKTIVDVAEDAGQFETLIAALDAAGLVGVLEGDGPFTVLAPNDKAFAALPDGTVESLLRPQNREKLAAILKYHVIPGRIEASDILSATSAETANGASLPIGLSIQGASVLATDIEASNGIIHVIDRVLIPEMEPASSASAELIRSAIERGAPMYNHGNAAGCAALYEIAAMAILELDGELSQGARQSLVDALDRSRTIHSSSDRAWTLRHGLDAAYKQMMEKPSSMSM